MNERHAFELTIAVGPNDHARGPDDSAVTLVEYGDFECPYCKQAAPAMKILLTRFAGRLRLVYRHFPQEEVHPHALRAAQAAEYAGVQGRFWEMHDMLFANQLRLEEADLRRYAEQLQLDVKGFDDAIAAGTHLERVRADQRSGAESGVRATPTFFLDGRILDASYGLQSVAKAIEQALRR